MLALVALVAFNFIWNSFVRLYCDSWSYQWALKKKSKLNFCVAILILKVKEKTNIFGMLRFISRKGKNWNAKKVCAVFGEDAENECVRSGLQSYVLEISVGRCFMVRWPVEVDSDQIKTLIENSQCYSTWDIADIPRISKSSVKNNLYLLGYVNCFDVWVPHKLSEENLLAVSLHAILYWNIRKTFGSWEVDVVQQCET